MPRVKQSVALLDDVALSVWQDTENENDCKTL